MDRFCSVTTGWNTSLTHRGIHRRLPVDGAMWKNNTSKCGRFFYGSENSEVDPTDADDCLGGYAYLIEATDCLSRVVDFLLETFDFATTEGLRLWFDKFQTLDSMLIRWKTFLPSKWQVVTVDEAGIMDENLTLAHVTYNTTVLLLHQNLAYPPSGSKLRITTKTSADTCLSVALEIARITEKFLSHVDITVSPQFALCVFVAARTILAHSIHFHTSLDTNFDLLVSSLQEMSRRWKGNFYTGEDLASNFVHRLEQARNTNSPIDATQAMLVESSTSESLFHTLASPPFVDLLGNPTTVDHDSSPSQYEDGYFKVPMNFELDHIFTWSENGPPPSDVA
jgi:hypothetical protein